MVLRGIGMAGAFGDAKSEITSAAVSTGVGVAKSAVGGAGGWLARKLGGGKKKSAPKAEAEDTGGGGKKGTPKWLIPAAIGGGLLVIGLAFFSKKS